MPVTLSTDAAKRRVDIAVLIDRSASMTEQLPTVTAKLAEALRAVAKSGVDVRVAVAAAGTVHPQPPLTPGQTVHNEDATADADNPSYTRPVLYARQAALGSVDAAVEALAAITPEVLAHRPVDGEKRQTERWQGQLMGIRQLITGEGYAGSAENNFNDAIPAGLSADWRADPTVERVLVDITDQRFDEVAPHAEATNDGIVHVDPAPVAKLLRDNRVHHVGLVVDDSRGAAFDLSALSALTGDVVPSGGLTCGDGTVAAGTPLVCDPGHAAGPAALAATLFLKGKSSRK